VAKVKVVNNTIDQNLNGDNFDNSTSQTVFQFGNFRVTSNFDGRELIDYEKELSTFVRPVTLETLPLTETESKQTTINTKNAVLNLDRSNLNTFTQFGSAYEFIRVSIENIIIDYPGSLFVDSNIQRGGNATFYDFNYDSITNITKFKVPTEFIKNKFGLVFNKGNDSKPDDKEIRNLNLSFHEYIIWSNRNPDDNSHKIIAFSGDSASQPNPYLTIQCTGNPFPFFTGNSVGYFDFHIKPNTRVFDDFRLSLNDYEKYIISNRSGTDGFAFTMKDPTLLDNGGINYTNKNILWSTSDGYNIDIESANYRNFLETVLGIGDKYDQIKTDLIARFLTPASLQTYDLTENKKTSKLLRIYGAEFDQLKQFIDNLVYVNRVTYDKERNLPDQIVSNLARTFGWDYSQLINEEELVDRLLDVGGAERRLDEDLIPAEVDIELWRRILINTNYFWKAKGTRDAIKSIFLMIGIPEPFINITEHIYTVDGKIDPREVELTLDDLPSASLPYNENGYPVAPKENSEFYFQISGDSDNGQTYMDNFRNVGFGLNYQVDNKKAWVRSGSTYRYHYSSPTYYQLDDDLVLNTKEVDIALDTSRGIEYDVFRYIKEQDFPANSTAYTMPYSYINLSLGITQSSQQTFTLPSNMMPSEGDIEVRYNGILLNSSKVYSGGTITTGNTENDYIISGDTLTLLGGAANKTNNNRDVVQVTYVYSGETSNPITGLTVNYIVSRVKPDPSGTKIMLPEMPSGDVQLTINGVAATKGTPQFNADYIINPSNPQELIIQNSTLISYFAKNPHAQIAMVHVNQPNVLTAKNEIHRVDSLTSGKVYFKSTANKTVLRLNYKINDAKNVKVLVNGIGLKPNADYVINPNNKYELYLPAGINFGDVISTYYLVGEDIVFTPIIDDGFGLGDISHMSFLEFIDLMEKRTINATNRKIITDFKGGWYPTLLNIYTTYLHRNELDDDDPLKSNGYTFENLYPFLNKYNTFFQRFVESLLSSTIIKNKSGLLIRNTVFTKQKFTYRRGVSFDFGGEIAKSLNYFGSDDVTYRKRPLLQTAKWTDDVICLPNICDNFIVKDINITYPTTTTTTTVAPFNSIMYVEERSSTYNAIVNGHESQIIYELVFSPEITPNYVVNVDLNFNFSLNNYYSGGTTNSLTLAEVAATLNNNAPFYTKLVENDTSNNQSPSGKTSVSIGVGDVVKIILYNKAQESSGIDILSKTVMIPNVTNVIPNGEIGVIIPSTITSTANSQ